MAAPNIVNVATITGKTVGAALNDEFQAIAYQMVSMVDTYRISEVDDLLDLKADQSTTYTKTETDDLLAPKATTGKAIAMAIVFGG